MNKQETLIELLDGSTRNLSSLKDLLVDDGLPIHDEAGYVDTDFLMKGLVAINKYMDASVQILRTFTAELEKVSPTEKKSRKEPAVDVGKDASVENILKQCRLENNVIYLPNIQFSKESYAKVKQYIEEAGGKWKGGKTQGFVFDFGIFTNLEPDHIGPNEHTSFEDYMACKSLLFRQCKIGIVNGDDAHVEGVIKDHTCTIETYGLGEQNMLRAVNLSLNHVPGQLGVNFETKGVWEMQAQVNSPGRFSVYNALCAIAICRHFNVDQEAVQKALMKVSVKGRIEMVKVPGEYTLLIDYAHNAMALRSLLETLKEYKPGRLICLFGCGGNRSRQRRFEMGEVSGKLADLTIITSDNPRFEEPEAIIEDIKTGITPTGGQYLTIIDRREAIAYAIANAKKGDLIVLAGKGHEDYQEIKGVKYPMDEHVMVEEILKEMNLK